MYGLGENTTSAYFLQDTSEQFLIDFSMVLSIVATVFSGFQAGANIVEAGAAVYGLIHPNSENVLKKPDRVVMFSPPNIHGLETLEKALHETLSHLKDEWDVKGIQIHGKLGTGKTTIMQHLNNHKLVAENFDVVIWLKVSSDGPDTITEGGNFSVEKLQKDVMNRLNLDLGIPVDQYKYEIMNALQNTKYLLLLDSVKAPLSLDEIGFPENWEERGSKVVFTTRFERVWRSMTDCSVEVGLLDLTQGIKMFSNILERSGNPIKTKYIIQAVQLCGFLVTAIKIVADNFKFERN
ncbi:hypothetical protein AgCh_022746 [Apium graveolens]